jgi:hypothetical protein
MKRNDEFIALLEEYLDIFDGPTPLPDRVRESVRADLPATGQVPAPSRSMERLMMFAGLSAPARIGLAAAAVVVAVIVGVAVLRPVDPSTVGDARPSPSAAAASASPLASGRSVQPDDGPARLAVAPGTPCEETNNPDCLVAGSYRLSSPTSWPADIRLTVPSGWFVYRMSLDYEGVLVDSPGAMSGSGWGLVMMPLGGVALDPCQPAGDSFPATDVDTPTEVAAAMATWSGFEVSAPLPVTVDGREGVRVDVTTELDDGECPSSRFFSSRTTSVMDAYPSIASNGWAQPATFRIVDVDGQLLVIWTSEFDAPSPFERGQGIGDEPDRHAGDRAELQTIIDSIQIEAP